MRPTLKVKVPLPSTILLFVVLLTVLAFPDTRGFRGMFFMILGWYLLFMMFVNRGPIHWIHCLWVISFYVLTILSEKWSVYPFGAEVVIGNVTYALILNWSLGEYVYQGRRSIGHMAAVMAVISLVMTVNFMMNSTVEDGRFRIGKNENVVGMIAAYMYGILLYSAKESQWKKWYITALAVAVAVITLLTGSRKALMMLLVFSAAYVFFWKPEKNMAKFLGRIIAVLCVCAVVLFLLMKVEVLYNAIGNRLESLYLQWVEGEEADGSAITRSRMLEIGMRLFKMEPLLGHGHNAFKYLSGYWTYSHNNYMELLCSLGICGLMLFYVPLIYFTIEAFRLWRRGVSGAILPLTILVMQFINDMAQVSYYSFHIHIFLGIAIGYVYLLKRQYREMKSKEEPKLLHNVVAPKQSEDDTAQ